ncbi:hypothetical protein GIB67_024130, partial [Kingdonia uniflora]
GKFTKHLLSSGKFTLFWQDPWHGQGVLSDRDSMLDDRVIWTPNNKGVFNVADTFEKMRAPRPVSKIFDLCWDSCTLPRHGFILWKTLKKVF